MTPLDSMRLTASDPEDARRAAEDILFATFGARPPEHDELQVVLGALEAVAADVRRRLAALDGSWARAHVAPPSAHVDVHPSE